MITLLLIIIYLAFISLGLPDSLFGAAWPSMYQGLGVNISAAGIFTIIVSGGTIISSFFSGVVIRKFGTGKVTFISVLMTAIALLGIAFTGNYVWLCVLGIPLGLGAGSVDAALNNFVALHYKARHMSWLHCFWGIGASIGPVIMGVCLKQGLGWSRGYITIGLIQSVLVIILLLSLPLWKRFENSEDKEQGARTQKAVSVKEILHIKGAKAAFVGFFCYCSVEATTGLWGSSYLILNRGLSEHKAASFVSAFFIGITLGRFFTGFLTMKISNKNLIRLGQLLIILGIDVIFIPSSIAVLAGIGIFIVGLGCAPIYPCLIHDTPRNFGEELSQSVMGMQMAFAYVGSTFIPPIFGLIAQYINVAVFPYYLLGFTVLMFVMIERLNKVNKQKQ